MDSTLRSQLHLVFIPLMAPGHLLPMVDMAKLFARRLLKVTIVTTPLNAIRFQTTIDREIQSGSHIEVLSVQFPDAEAGLPDGCESFDALPSMDLQMNFFNGICMLQKPLEELFEKLKPTPSCIISDSYMPCAADIARKFKIPRIIFDGTNCFKLLCTHNLHASKICESVSDSEPFLVPGMPDKIQLTKCQLPGPFNAGSTQNLNFFRDKVRKEESVAYGIVVNSFEELELEYLKEYKRVTGINNVWCIGPVSLSNTHYSDKANRGKKNSNDDSQYIRWLDSRPQSSVIYVCLGSLNRVTPEQLMELGLGLEATNRPFIWVIRGVYRKEEMEKWLSESGFEERVKNRGILIRGWAPQVLILSHTAIGAFLTHCGWNSTMEGICSGVPLITFPLYAEQFYNEKVAVQVAETGVRVGAERAVRFGDEEKFGVQVKRENVKEAIEKVMGEDEESERRRERARNYADMAKKAIEEGGSSYRNMSLLIEDINWLLVTVPLQETVGVGRFSCHIYFYKVDKIRDYTC